MGVGKKDQVVGNFMHHWFITDFLLADTVGKINIINDF